MPNTPEENDQQNSLQIPPKESDTSYEQKQRRENEAPPETLEQSAITVRAYHARQVMTHGTEGSYKEIYVVRTPPRLGQRERGYQQQRGADVQDQVPPGTEYP
jgi:hypothetical protein